MGQETIDELLELAEEHNHKSLTNNAMLRLVLVLLKENYKETRKINGTLRETVDRISEIERYPSLVCLVRKHPRQMIIAALAFFVLIHIVTDFHLMDIILDYVRMFM